MKTYILENFKNKLDTPSYPIYGFWVGLDTGFNPNIKYRGYHGSQLYKSNLFIRDNNFDISFKTNWDEPNGYNYLYLFSLDALEYSSDSIILNNRDPKFISIVLELHPPESTQTQRFYRDVTYIYTINYPVKCSLKSYYNTPANVNHYTSDNIGAVNAFSNQQDRLIDRETGIHKIKENLSPTEEGLHITESGLIII